MAVIAARALGSKRVAWRSIVFPLIAFVFALASLLVLEGLTEGLMPWVIIGCPGCESSPEWRRWLGAIHGSMLGVLFSGSLLLLLRRPETKPLLLQFYALGHLTFLVGMFGWFWQPEAYWAHNLLVPIAFPTVIALLAVTFPGSRQTLFEFSRTMPFSRPLLALTGLSAAALVPAALRYAQLQLQSGGATPRWAESVVVMVVLVLAGFLASTRRQGWRELGVLVGVTYLYLGAAALTVPDQAGSWGIGGGVASLAGGLAYIGATLSEATSTISSARG